MLEIYSWWCYSCPVWADGCEGTLATGTSGIFANISAGRYNGPKRSLQGSLNPLSGEAMKKRDSRKKQRCCARLLCSLVHSSFPWLSTHPSFFIVYQPAIQQGGFFSSDRTLFFLWGDLRAQICKHKSGSGWVPWFKGHGLVLSWTLAFQTTGC